MTDGDHPAAEPTPATASHRTFADLTPLRASPAFARLWFGQAISGIGSFLTLTAVGLLIFDIASQTMDVEQATFLVALVGPISLIPMIIAGLWGGMLVDAFDRRTIAIIFAILSWLSTLAILAMSLWDLALRPTGVRIDIWPLYVFSTVNAVAVTISGAARSAIIPRILPEDMVSRAAALNGIPFGIQVAVGPALAGVLVATAGFEWTFGIDAVLFTAGFLGIVTLPKLPPLENVARPGLQSLKDGARFLRNAPNIRMGFISDIIAMGFGRPNALFPAIGAVAIGGGAVTVGVLTAAMAVGTFLAGLFSGPVARIRHHGVAISRAIMLYGACTALFGVVVLGAMLGWFGPIGTDFGHVSWPALVLAFIALAGTGVSDEFSAIFRTTMLLTAAPDDMRGRLQGIFMIVVTGGPRIGDLIAGSVAALIALWAPSLIGGVVIVALIYVLFRVSPRWRNYDARNPTPLSGRLTPPPDRTSGIQRKIRRGAVECPRYGGTLSA